jgi:hypothetical protein
MRKTVDGGVFHRCHHALGQRGIGDGSGQAKQRLAPDCLQPPRCFGFRQQVKAGVGLHNSRSPSFYVEFAGSLTHLQKR